LDIWSRRFFALRVFILFADHLLILRLGLVVSVERGGGAAAAERGGRMPTDFMVEQPKGNRGKRLTILSIDGGGVRGLISATILAELEGKLQRLDGPEVRLVDYFDLIAGTSTGGLITSMLTTPLEDSDKQKPVCTAKDVVQFYLWYSAQIFPHTG
jgi:hypothetical protein